MNYERVNWEDGSLAENGYVEIEETRYPVVMPTYSCDTPMTAQNLNVMDAAIKKIADYIDARYKTLWTGSWASGSITVDNINKYNSIIVFVDTNDGIVCYRNGNGSMFQGNTIIGNVSNGSQHSKVFRCTVSNNTLTWHTGKELAHNASSNHNAGEAKTVSKIIGLDPIVE